MKRIKINDFEEKLYFERLTNGLEIYLFLTPKQKSYSAYFTTKFGGSTLDYIVDKNIYSIIPGTAHFLEHKLFEQESGESALAFYAKSGSNVNAWTSKKSTTYYFEGCDNFEENLSYLIDFVLNPYITDDNVKKEKGIIKQEIRMYKDSPDSIIIDHLYKNMLYNDNIKYSVAGEEKDIDRINKKNLLECYKTFYQPNNMFLVVIGNFKPKKIIDLIKNKIVDKSNNIFEIVKKEEPDTVVKKYEEIYMDVKSNKFALAYKINKNIFVDDMYLNRYYLDIILESNFGASSQFKEEARIDKLFTSFYTCQVECENHVIIMFLGDTTRVKDMIKRIKEKVKKMTVSNVEFERAKKIYIANEIRSIENQEAVSDSIISDVINYGKYYNQKINDINNLKYDRIREIINNLDFTNYSEVVITRKKNS